MDYRCLAKHFYENMQCSACINLSGVLWFHIQSYNVYKIEEHGEPAHCFNPWGSNGLGIIHQVTEPQTSTITISGGSKGQRQVWSHSFYRGAGGWGTD